MIPMEAMAALVGMVAIEAMVSFGSKIAMGNNGSNRGNIAMEAMDNTGSEEMVALVVIITLGGNHSIW